MVDDLVSSSQTNGSVLSKNHFHRLSTVNDTNRQAVHCFKHIVCAIGSNNLKEIRELNQLAASPLCVIILGEAMLASLLQSGDLVAAARQSCVRFWMEGLCMCERLACRGGSLVFLFPRRDRSAWRILLCA
jgi:hypothetical protein